MALIETVTNRRALLRGLGAIIAAPAIVRVASLMPLSCKRTMDTWRGIPIVECTDLSLGPSIDSPIWVVSWGEETIYSMFPESTNHASPADASPVPAAATILTNSRRRLLRSAKLGA